MKSVSISTIIGVLLVAAGIVFLLGTLNLFDLTGGVVIALLFAFAGAVFLGVFVADRDQWWAAIPGFTLLALGALIALGVRGGRLAETWGGALFLGGIGLGFLVVYLTRPVNWWAMIPGGTLLTLALVAGVADTFQGVETGGIFFLGLGVTFGLVYLLPTPAGRQRWAVYPAAVLLALGLLIGFTITKYWPAVLILLGGYLLYGAMRRSRQ